MDSSSITSTHSLPLPHFKESFSAIAYPLSPKDTTLLLPPPQQQSQHAQQRPPPSSKLTHSATSLHHYSFSQYPQMSPVSSSSSASLSPKPVLKRKPFVHDEVQSSSSPSTTFSGLPSAAAVADFAAADVLDNMAEHDTAYHPSSHHRSMSHPHHHLYHHLHNAPSFSHQRQSSCSSVTPSSAPSPHMMRRQRASSRAQTPPRQRQVSGSSICSNSSFRDWSIHLSTPGSTCPSLTPSAAPSPMVDSNGQRTTFDNPAHRKRSKTISHLDRALKEETLSLLPLQSRDSRSPSMEAASPVRSPSASCSSDDEAKKPSSETPARRSTLDDLVYAISLDEDLTANVKQAMATFEKLPSLPSCIPANKALTCGSPMTTNVANATNASTTTNKSTSSASSSNHRRRMTMGCPGESDPHAIRVVYFAPGCVDDHLAKARAL